MKSILLFGCVLLCSVAKTQISIVSTLNNTGHTSTAGAVQLEWSAGEQVSIRSFSNGSFIFTTGILQGVTPTPTGIPYVSISASEISLFPVPSNDFLNAVFKFNKPGKVFVQIYQANGMLTAAFTHVYTGSRFNQTYRTDQLAAGAYTVHVVFIPVNGVRQQGSYKITIQH